MVYYHHLNPTYYQIGMIMSTETRNDLHSVRVQRDELRSALDKVYDRIRQGAYNHMFRDENPRASGSDKEKCKEGYTRHGVIWCCGSCCGECDGRGKDCQLSFEEQKLFKAIRSANKLLDERDAEMPESTPRDFPVYDPDHNAYEATDRWIARNLYKFAVGYWLFGNHSDLEEEKKWEKAFDNLLAICLDAIGKNGKAYRTLISKIPELMEKGPYDEEKAKKFREEYPEIVSLMEEATDLVFVNEDKVVTTTYLVNLALTLRMDYQFGHKYPGADRGVYGDAFCSLIDVALKLVGLDNPGRIRREDGESEEDYERRKIEARAIQKEKIYRFIQESDGLTIKFKQKD